MWPYPGACVPPAGDELVSKEVSPDAEQEASLLSLQNEVLASLSQCNPPPPPRPRPSLGMLGVHPAIQHAAAPHRAMHARTGAAATEPYPYP